MDAYVIYKMHKKIFRIEAIQIFEKEGETHG